MRIRHSLRLLTLAFAGAVLASLITVLPAMAAASIQYRFDGRGWGHGIGLSQYGAQGYATEEGWDYKQILGHYYTDTVVAPAPANSPKHLRVLLQSHLDPARITVESAATIERDGSRFPVTAGSTIEVRTYAGKIRVEVVNGDARSVVGTDSSSDIKITPSVDGSLRTMFKSDHAEVGARFRGSFTARIYEGKISVVNNIAFEQYLRGVVPDEMPPSWNIEALKAQAVAARSYALTGLATDYNWFDMYSDTRSQVYGGMSAEEESTDLAIEQTANEVVRVGNEAGEMARTFFFSTSGGKTAANEQVWSSTPYSYLRSVPSPYESTSRLAVWQGKDVPVFSHSDLAKRLRPYYKGSFRGVTVKSYSSGYVATMTVRGSAKNGRLRGDQVRSILGLNSSWFRVNTLRLDAPRSVQQGRVVAFRGSVPKFGVTHLWIRANGRTYRRVRVVPKANGTFMIRTRAHSNLTASLIRGGKSGAALRIQTR